MISGYFGKMFLNTLEEKCEKAYIDFSPITENLYQFGHIGVNFLPYSTIDVASNTINDLRVLWQKISQYFGRKVRKSLYRFFANNGKAVSIWAYMCKLFAI
jgi:hypothetical protein